MNTPLIAALSAVLLLTACGSVRESRVNPMNWFGSGRAPDTLMPATGYVTPENDPRPLADQISGMHVERIPGGVIVRAIALQPTQGWWSAELVAQNDARPVDGVLTLRFLLAPPPEASRVSTPRSREVTSAIYIPDARLGDTRQVVVQGARNALSSSR